MMAFHFEWSSYVVNLLLSLCLWFLIANRIPVLKKGDKPIGDNYRPVSLLSIFGKFFEKLLFNSIMDFLEGNNLLSSNQSGFRSNDSCESQLLSIVHVIYCSFDCHPSLEVRGISLDISKAFDRVWYGGLLYKIQSIGKFFKW